LLKSIKLSDFRSIFNCSVKFYIAMIMIAYVNMQQIISNKYK